MQPNHSDGFLPVQHVVLALSKARGLIASDLDAALASTGLSGSHVGALVLLSLGVARSPVGLSRQMGISPGFVSRVIDHLQSRGLVRRDRTSVDRRLVDLSLTEAGRTLGEQVASIVPAVLDRRMSVLEPQELAALHRLLGKLLDT